MEDEQNKKINPFNQIIEQLLLEGHLSNEQFLISFPKTSKANQRTKFVSLLNSSSNPRLSGVTQTLLQMLNANRSAYEIVLFMNAQFEVALRNTLYFCFHRILHCDDKVLKDWLPHFRIETTTFVGILEKIARDSGIKLNLGGSQVSLHHATRSQMEKLFPAKKDITTASELAFNFAIARHVRHQIIHGSRIGRTQSKGWDGLTIVTKPQCYRACCAIFSMYEAYEEATSLIFFKPQGSVFNPFQSDMRGKKEAGARASEHQTKMILNACGISAPNTLKR